MKTMSILLSQVGFFKEYCRAKTIQIGKDIHQNGNEVDIPLTL